MLPSDKGGSATSSSRAELATPGATVIARIWMSTRIRSAGFGLLAARPPTNGRPKDGKVPVRPETKTSNARFLGTEHCRARYHKARVTGGSPLMEAVGRTRWAIAEGYIPSESSFSERA